MMKSAYLRDLRQEVQSMRVGIFGGTFDPVHLAHLLIAQEALVQAHLDYVLFIPAGRPPHKANSVTATAQQRQRMVELAIQPDPHFALDAFELRQNGPSYTINTLAHLKETHPCDEFFLILGGDMVRDLVHWHHPQQILDNVTGIIGIERPGFQFTLAATTELNAVMPGLATKLIPVQTPQLDISSSLIRQRIAQNLPVRYFMPDAVADYILANQLYQMPKSIFHEAHV